MLPAYGGPGAFAQAKLICFILDTQAVSNYIYMYPIITGLSSWIYKYRYLQI